MQEMKRGKKRRQQSIEDSLEQARKRLKKDEQAEQKSSNEKITKAENSHKLSEEMSRAEQLCCADECIVQSSYGQGQAEQRPGGENGQWLSEEAKPTPTSQKKWGGLNNWARKITPHPLAKLNNRAVLKSPQKQSKAPTSVKKKAKPNNCAVQMNALPNPPMAKAELNSSQEEKMGRGSVKKPSPPPTSQKTWGGLNNWARL